MTNTTAPSISFINNPHAPDVFADGLTGVYVLGGCLRMSFEVARMDNTTSPGALNRVEIGRLVMPIDAAENMAKFVLDFITRLKTQANAPVQQSTDTMH
jgi:hypothetical protein